MALYIRYRPIALGGSGGGGGVTTMGPFGSTPNANGGDITGSVLTLEPADGTHPGGVSIIAQTFGGNKTFLGSISAANLSGTNTGDVTIGTANGLSLISQALSLGLSSTSTTGALSSTDWNTFNNKQAAGNYITALTGDATATGPGSVALTLATVNSNVGTFGAASNASVFTVNAKGLITAASDVSIQIAESQVTNLVSDLASKVNTSSLGNLIDAGTDGIVVTGGTGAVVGSVSLAQHVADTTHNGYLSSTDWNTFNNKGTVTSIGTIDSQTPSANGLVIAGSSLYAQSASISNPGMVNNIGQAFSGNKQFTANMSIGPSAPVGTLALNLQGTTSGVTQIGLRVNTSYTGTPDTITYQEILGTIPSSTLTAYGLRIGQLTNVGSPNNIYSLYIDDVQELGTAANIYGIFQASTTNKNRINGPTSIQGTLTLGSSTGALSAASGVVSVGTLSIGNGGTGQTTKAAAFDALSPMTTGGDIIYGGASGTGTRLANGSSGQFLKSNGTTLAPSWANPTITLTAPTIQKFITGTGTYNLPSPAPLYIEVELVGPGGGGGANGTAATDGNPGSASTTFGTTLLSGGPGGGGGSGTSGGGGTGGTASLGTGPVGLAIPGARATGSSDNLLSACGSPGGSSYFGGAGPGAGPANNPGMNATANTGSGGGGASGNGAFGAAAGGGAGGYVRAIITSPSSTYSYVIGTGGTGASAGVGGNAGGNGADGMIIVYEYYQ